MRIRTILPLPLLLLVASAAYAAHEADLYVIPAAAHTAGAAGTNWTTDVTIHNSGSSAVTVSIHFIESGFMPAASLSPVLVDGEASLTLAPGETRTITDLLAAQRAGAGVTGALILEGDGPFIVTSRTATPGTGAGAVGATVAPVAALFDASPANGGEASVLPAVSMNAAARSNVGLLVASLGSSLTVEVMLLGPTGAPLGQRTITFPGEGFAHLQFSLADIAPAFDDATAVVRITNGEGLVVPYAAVVDNNSGDPSVMTGGIVSSAATSAAAVLRGMLATR